MTLENAQKRSDLSTEEGLISALSVAQSHVRWALDEHKKMPPGRRKDRTAGRALGAAGIRNELQQLLDELQERTRIMIEKER